LPPLFLGVSGYAMSRLLRARLVLNVSDLWPESAVAMGILRNRLLIRLSKGLEEFLYARADLITGQTEGIVQNVQRRFPTKRVALITNGVDVQAFPGAVQPGRRRAVRREFSLADGFVVGYAGLHGHAQGLETVVSAARLLENEPDLVFAFFGEGPRKDELMALARGATNVRFFAAQPSLRMSDVLASFDVALIPLRRLALFRGALPSKLFEAMAAELPVVVSVEGEAQALVERSGAGVSVEPENSRALADAVMKLRANPELRRRMGENGRRYVVAHYDRAQIANQFESLLRRAVGNGSRPASERKPDGGIGPFRETDHGDDESTHVKTGRS
jgi:glycosyltransferase involved in cell wall biosynthesis